MKRRILVAILTTCLVCGLLFSHAFATSVEPSSLLAITPAQDLLAQKTSALATTTLQVIHTADFTDVPATSPYYDAASYISYRNVMQGVGGGQFAPEMLVTRSAVLTVLYRLSGETAPAYDGRFSDVSAESWFAPPLAWAVSSGIVTSTGGKISPNQQITRTELAALLYQYASYQSWPIQCSNSLAAFQDGASVPAPAVTPMSWAAESRIFAGMVSDRLHPFMAVSRGQLAQAVVGLVGRSTGDPIAMEILRAYSTPVVASASQKNHAAIQATVNSIAKKYGAIGLQVAVVENGVVTDTFACGWATKGSTPMTSDHKMRVASISKVLVGVNAMLLAERNIVDLDEGIGTYWGTKVQNPYHPNTRITVRNMLNHTSSIALLGDDASRSRSRSAVQARLNSTSGYNRNTPGSIYGWGYNNYGYAVLGMTLELAAGRTADSTLNEWVFDPLDIDASFASGSIERTDMLATLYYSGGSVARSVSTQKGLTLNPTPGASGSFFAGGLTTSAADLGKIAALLAGDGRYAGLQLLSEPSVVTMEQYNSRMVSGGFYQALPLRYQTNIYGRNELYYHTGSAYGVYNLLSYDPATGDGVVVLTTGASATRDAHGIYAVGGEISRHIYSIIA